MILCFSITVYLILLQTCMWVIAREIIYILPNELVPIMTTTKWAVLLRTIYYKLLDSEVEFMCL